MDHKFFNIKYVINENIEAKKNKNLGNKKLHLPILKLNPKIMNFKNNE